jgi:ribosomal protein S18
MKNNTKKKVISKFNIDNKQNLELSKDFLDKNFLYEVSSTSNILDNEEVEFLRRKKRQENQIRHNTPFGNYDDGTHARTFNSSIIKINRLFERRLKKLKNIYNLNQKNIFDIISKKIILLKINVINLLKLKKNKYINYNNIEELFDSERIENILLLKEKIAALVTILLFSTKNLKINLNYLKPNILRLFLNEYGEINSSLKTFLSKKEQKKLTFAIKRARIHTFLPFVCNYEYNSSF